MLNRRARPQAFFTWAVDQTIAMPVTSLEVCPSARPTTGTFK